MSEPALLAPQDMENWLLSAALAGALLHLDLQPSAALQNLCQSRDKPYRWHKASASINLNQRFDLAIVNANAFADTPSLIKAIGLCKNILSHKVLIYAQRSHDPFREHFISMGFKSQKSSNNEINMFYSYNIAAYNFKRDWNNTKHWANPEHWHRRF